MNLWRRDPPAEDLRYEYRTVRYPKAQKKTAIDLYFEEYCKNPEIFRKWGAPSVLGGADAYWRWTAEYRENPDSTWKEISVSSSEYSAEYDCKDHAKKRAAPVIKNLGKLP